MRQIVRPHQHLVILLGIQRRPGLQHHHTQPAFCEDLRGHPAGRTRPDNANVVLLRRLRDLGHELSSPPHAHKYRMPSSACTNTSLLSNAAFLEVRVGALREETTA